MRILYFFVIFPLFAFSQGEFNTWYFGQHAGISFTSGVPVALPPNPMDQGGVRQVFQYRIHWVIYYFILTETKSGTEAMW
jgi:hypothetical protein